MNFIILFEDDATLGPEVRRKHLPDHLDFLKQHANVISAAGHWLRSTRCPSAGSGSFQPMMRRPPMRWSEKIRSGSLACASP